MSRAVYIYADETGNLDFDSHKKKGGKDYFGFGTATYVGAHGEQMFSGMSLRAALERQGVSTERGFHAYKDSWKTKGEVYELLKTQQVRFDITLLAKSNAYDSVRERGEMYLYKLAWFLHIKEVVQRVSTTADLVYIIVGTFGTKERAAQAKAAIHDVCSQLHRVVTVCVWDAATSWGLQVADYGTWAVQRHLSKGPFSGYVEVVEPMLATEFYPWKKSAK